MAKQWFVVYFVLSLNIVGQLAAMPVEDDDDGGRIVGGEAADISEAPYQLSVQMQGHFCGAAIIGEYWAISAAHCFTQGSYGVTLLSGTSYHRRGGQKHQVERIINHPQYNKNNQDYDIAVIKVKNPFKLGSQGVNCIRLASRQPSPGTLAMATGWGALVEGGAGPEQLQKVSVPVVSNQECNQSYDGTITKNMLCAGYKQGGKDACQGDSGGPLAAQGELIGVVSFGRGCALPNYYGVYSNVNELRNWVVGITGPLRC